MVMDGKDRRVARTGSPRAYGHVIIDHGVDKVGNVDDGNGVCTTMDDDEDAADANDTDTWPEPGNDNGRDQ